ncbi:hypothetical protein [Xanthocytophaga agilis]|uniref:Transcriptional regulator, AbiEi antitoxin, Type IV TA system n=1 Tax=Xanthocytophaga agilis TaxID=3048010 RepID=A0AAE3UID7_9BACT|nr:hypothetical protein [Xanthocytophaga agilis]MDJ1505261.1 hypothetical protein [Xanthocytophaga agilis]
MDFTRKARQFTNAPFSRQLMLEMLKEYKRPNDKISELIKAGLLISLKKGLYIPGANAELPGPHPFLIANHLYGPSYVSLESALSYWELIPERVYEISSVTLKASKTYKTPKGRFSYQHIPSPYYSFGLRSVELQPNQVALLASPEKALCDKIVTTSGISLRSSRQVMDFLLDDLRIDYDKLKKLDKKVILSWADDAPKSNSIHMLVKALKAL